MRILSVLQFHRVFHFILVGILCYSKHVEASAKATIARTNVDHDENERGMEEAKAEDRSAVTAMTKNHNVGKRTNTSAITNSRRQLELPLPCIFFFPDRRRSRWRRPQCTTPAPTSSPTVSPTGANAPVTIASYVASDPELSILNQALGAFGLDVFLNENIDVTLFAPNDSAFNVLETGYQQRLLETSFLLHLIELLSYHVHAVASLESGDLQNGSLEMANGDQVTVSVDGGVAVSGPLFNNSAVVSADILATNGVVHKVGNTVFLPAYYGVDFVDLLAGDAMFTILTGLVVQAGLEETLRTGFYTVLAPPDPVWQANQELLDYLQAEENAGDLDRVLTYHVLVEVLPSAELLIRGNTVYTTATDIEGDTISVTVSEAGVVVFAGTAAGTLVDVLVRNGIAHVVDGIVLPPGFSITPTTTPAPWTPAPVTPAPVGTTTPVSVPARTTAPTTSLSIYELVAANSDLSELLELIDATAYDVVLNSATLNMTLNAPLNSAFDALDTDTRARLDALEEPQWTLHTDYFLFNHLVRGSFLAAQIGAADEVILLSDEIADVTTELRDTVTTITLSNEFFEATLVETDGVGSNGVVHTVDDFFFPNWWNKNHLDVATELGLTGAITAVERAAETLKFQTEISTFFAPTNEYLQTLSTKTGNYLRNNIQEFRDILEYHLSAGIVPQSAIPAEGTQITMSGNNAAELSFNANGDLLINGVTVGAEEHLSNNGIVRTIDGLLIPPGLIIPGLNDGA